MDIAAEISFDVCHSKVPNFALTSGDIHGITADDNCIVNQEFGRTNMRHPPLAGEHTYISVTAEGNDHHPPSTLFLDFMYGCAALSFASDLLRMSQLVQQATAGFTGRSYSGGIIVSIAFAEQYVIQGVNVRLEWVFLIMRRLISGVHRSCAEI